MEALFVGLVKLFASSGFGTIFGGLMGWANRKIELEAKKLEYQDRDKQRAHELAQRDKDAAILDKEWAGRVKVAEVEGETTVQREAYSALAKSYEFAQPEKGTRMAAFSAFVRPFVSSGYFVISTIGSGYILYYAFYVSQIKLTSAQLIELVMFTVSWIAFMAGTTIGWWYATRPGRDAPVLFKGGLR